MKLRFAVVLVIGVGFGSGCAPSLSTFQPAHVPPPRSVSASAGFEVGVPVGAVEGLLDAGKAAAQMGREQGTLNEAQTWEVFDAAVNLALNMPSVGPHFAIGYVPVKRFELGVRYAGSAWRFGGRFQILDHLTGPFDMTLGLGVTRFTFKFPLSDQIPGLELSDFSRWQLDVPLLVGTSRDWFRVWIGPKVVLTTFQTEMTLTLPQQMTVARLDGKAMFVGGVGGIAIGYRKLFLALELTLAQGMGTAHLTAMPFSPHDTKLSSFVVFPSIGLLGEF